MRCKGIQSNWKSINTLLYVKLKNANKYRFVFQLLVSRLINASVGPVEEGIGYTKEEQLAWATPDNECGGNFQSPVAISTNEVSKKYV